MFTPQHSLMCYICESGLYKFSCAVRIQRPPQNNSTVIICFLSLNAIVEIAGNRSNDILILQGHWTACLGLMYFLFSKPLLGNRKVDCTHLTTYSKDERNNNIINILGNQFHYKKDGTGNLNSKFQWIYRILSSKGLQNLFTF